MGHPKTEVEPHAGPSRHSRLGDVVRRIREHRGGSGTSRAQFGRDVGTTGQFIGQVEAGRKAISETTAFEIAERYSHSPEERRALFSELTQAILEFHNPAATSLRDPLLAPALLGELIEHDLASAQKTAPGVAAHLGFEPDWWSQLETGVLGLSAAALDQLARYLGADPEEYLVASGQLPTALTERLQAAQSPVQRRAMLRALIRCWHSAAAAEQGSAPPAQASSPLPEEVTQLLLDHPELRSFVRSLGQLSEPLVQTVLAAAGAMVDQLAKARG